MKKILLLIPAALAFQSCSNSLSEEQTTLLNKQFKKGITVYSLNGKSLTSYEINPSSFVVVDKVAITDEEEKQIDSHIMQTRAFGVKGYDIELKKYIVGAQYTAPEDGTVLVGDTIYKDMPTFEMHKDEMIKSETHNKECAKTEYTFAGRYCSQYKFVKVENYDEKLKEVQQKLSHLKVLKKGDHLITNNYEVAFSTESVEGKSRTTVKYKEQKARATASK